MKKGFTLIELLAVIVVLAVIAIIAIPVITNVIDKAKQGALKDSAYGIKEAAELYLAKNMNTDISSKMEFTCSNGKCLSGTEEIDYKGKINNGTIIIFDLKNIAFCVENNKYSAIKNINDKDVKIEKGTCQYDDSTNNFISTSNMNNGELDFNIKNYTSNKNIPSSGSEYDIAIITDKIDKYTISISEPKNPSINDLWIQISSFSDITIEKGNSIIPISSIKKYNGTIWEYVESYIYYENKWMELKYEWEYNFTNSYQLFSAPISGTYKIELWGAEGAEGHMVGGAGGYSSGIINLAKDTNLYVYVGQKSNSFNGGYNGGGNGIYDVTGGGGATDIRLLSGAWNNSLSLNSRIIVAGAGGGGAFATVDWYSTGGAAGGLNGGLSLKYSSNAGPSNHNRIANVMSTQVSAGAHTFSTATKGNFGIGGNAYKEVDTSITGGGGGGYYGGGGGAYGAGAGGGGSSYISGHTGCVAITSESNTTPKSGCTTGTTDNSCSVHYSGYKFTNTIMIDGEGYNWTNVRGSLVNMPTHDGLATMIGNSGNGYAKITLLSID